LFRRYDRLQALLELFLTLRSHRCFGWLPDCYRACVTVGWLLSRWRYGQRVPSIN